MFDDDPARMMIGCPSGEGGCGFFTWCAKPLDAVTVATVHVLACFTPTVDVIDGEA